jgi:branched-chain amino acid transport system substrate-binding protein
MKGLISLTALTVALGCGSAQAQYSDGTIKIGVMNDMSGTYSDLSGQGSVVAARKIHPMYLFEVKKPAESKGPWDYYKVRATIPAEEAFRPLAEGGCPLVKS